MPKAIIIGTGIAGLASAVRLAIKGYSVEVYEANSYPGGKLSEIKSDGFRFDAGPSLLTMPHYIDELFKLANKNPKDYFQYQKLDLVCKYFYEDGTQINAWSDKTKFAEEINTKTNDSKVSVLKFLDKSAEIYNITNHIFLEKSLSKLKSYLTWKTLKSILSFLKIDAFRTMNEANHSFFIDDKTRQLFNRYATYNGSNPYQAPATLNVIPHLEHYFGAYFPTGGMYNIVAGLVNLLKELGVKIYYNSVVEEIIINNKKAIGVKVNGEINMSDLVISNMDVWFTYKNLLKDQYSPPKILQQERSSSALIFYWGIQKTCLDLDLHNIFFSSDYQKEFGYIWKQQLIYNDPTIYVNISSKLKPDDAPQGCENWFTMINVPANNGQDWDKLIVQARENILSKLSRVLKEDIASLITSETVLDPRGIEAKTSSFQGSLYGTSSNNQFSAFLRHANFSSKLEGLYFVGGSVHPGGGIPLALLSAKIVSSLIPK